jgi:hypothetical protein
MRSIRTILFLCACAAACVLTDSGVAQVRTQPPGKERVDGTYKRRTEIDGNNVRTSVFNYLFSGRLGGGQGVAYEWPKNTRREYIALVALWIGGEVIDNEGNLVRIVNLPAFRSNPANGADWNMLPIPGYFNDKRAGGGIIAKSDDPSSWPATWPDKLADPNDPGWAGKWNGYFGKNQFSADQEMYYRVGDDNYDRFNYSPDTTDLARRGLGLIVDTRVLQWSQVSVANAVFFIHEFRNDGTKDIRKVGTTIWLADLVGGDGDSQDDTPDFNLKNAIAYSLDKDGTSSNPNYQGAFVGAAATSFLETPGNAVDRIDNDRDSPENPVTGNGPPVTTALTAGEISGDAIDNNGNGLTDEDSTYLQNTRGDAAATFGDGIDNNGDGESGSPLVTQQMINQAVSDRWHRWPPNPESDALQQGPGGSPIIHLIDLGQEDLNGRFNDNVDNNGNCEANLPTVTQAMIDQASTDPYLRYRVPGTSVILYNLGVSALGRKYLNADGLRDPQIDERIDEMVDESRDDGVDNNTDWDALSDDVGLDGAPNTHDVGEGDGKPTSGAGTSFPGEPHIDKTDVKEADRLGVTNVQYNRAGSINFSTTADVVFWSDYMTPGKFVDPEAIKIAGPGDYDLYVSSGFFPLKAGQTERVSYSVVMGNAVRTGSGDASGAKADADTNRARAQLAYDQNYQFAQVPLEPRLTAVPGDRRVALYWDDLAERSQDRFLAGVPGGDPKDFEGYRIYRSTDPAFEDAKTLRDGFGNPVMKPIVQFDLKNGVKGFSTVPFNGVLFDLGNDTGLQHSWVDTTVQNGQKYYYAVRAYDRGFEPIKITPSESNIRISIDNVTGEVKEIGQSVAIVVPEAPALGYVKPGTSNLTLVAGSTTGTAEVAVIDPTKLRDARYRISFEDTVLQGSATAPDTFKTKTFTLARVSAGGAIDTLIGRSRSLADTLEQPITDGFRVVLHNEKNFGLNPTLSRWSKTTIWPYDFNQWKGGFVIGQQRPSDYRVIFGPVGADTSTSYKVQSGTSDVTLPSMPVNFRVFNISEQKKIKFAFFDIEPTGGPGVFGAGQVGTRIRSDVIIFLETDQADSLITTWSFAAKYDPALTAPASGDTASIVLAKLFRASDVFEFTTVAQTIDLTLAKHGLDRIKVVPNPYVAAATWEERNPFSTGRGPRAIHFNHLPPKCTIRIYNVGGDLVATLHHDVGADIIDGTEEWNLLTRDNLSVAYGVYIYHVDAPGIGEKIGKFAVIK